MADQHPRRWFRYSLRTLFVVVTLLCCYLGWQLSIVRQRQRALHELQGRSVQIVTADDWIPIAFGNPLPSRASVPVVRRWLGDKAIQEIWHTPAFADSLSQSELSRFQEVFPEATVYERHLEPCHPGCFPRGTLVDTPSGRQPIEQLHAGDVVVTLDSSGERATAAIETVFITSNTLWRIVTDEATLLTTRTQPLYTTADITVTAGQLQAGDSLLVNHDGEIRSARVLEVSVTERTERVFNLILGGSQAFVAGGFLARSKPPAARSESVTP